MPAFSLPNRIMVLLGVAWLGWAGADEPRPRAAIFTGLPGDAERGERYLATTNALRQALIEQAGVPAGDVVVLFGRDKSSPYPECNANHIGRELDRLRHAARDRRPVWIFVLGHANTVKDKVYLNIAGNDMEIRDFARRLNALPRYTPLVVAMTTAASGNCLAALAGPNRCVVVTTQPGAEDNETEFPHLLAEVLANARDHDANGDGRLSVNEMVAAVRHKAKAWYAGQRLLPTEFALIDAAGDGKPAIAGSEEERRAEDFALRLHIP